VVAFWIFVATRSGANLSEHPRMLASVPKIKNGAPYQPQLMTEQRTEARDLSRPPRQDQRATAEVIRLLPQVASAPRCVVIRDRSYVIEILCCLLASTLTEGRSQATNHDA
jgi:hypothetical protein